MKKHSQIFMVILVVFIFMTNLLCIAKQTDDSLIIKDKMQKLGFQVGKITKSKDGTHSVSILRFKTKGKGLILKGTFKPFQVKVMVAKGKLHIEKKPLGGDRFIINERQLPSDIILVESSGFSTLREFIKNENIEIIRNHLRSARRTKRDAETVVGTIESQVAEALRLLDECLPYDPSLLSMSPPMSSRAGLSTSAYITGGIGSCRHYVRNAETAKENAERHLRNIRAIIENVNHLKDYIRRNYRTGRITDLTQTSLRTILTNLQDSGRRIPDRIEGCIEDIERFLADYPLCMDRIR